jgi:hypothetical protein
MISAPLVPTNNVFVCSRKSRDLTPAGKRDMGTRSITCFCANYLSQMISLPSLPPVTT